MTIKITTPRDIDHTNARIVTRTDYAGETTADTVWTNDQGHGLWINGKQVLGTGQFSSGKNATNAIRHWYQRNSENA